MKVWRMMFLCAIGLVFGVVSTGYTAPVDVMITKNDAQPGPSNDQPLQDQIITFMGLNPNATTDASITFSVRGDFNGSFDNVTLSMDGLSLGVWLNSSDADDVISEPVDDVGLLYVTQTGSVAVPLAIFTPLIADGQLDFFFDYSAGVLDFFGGLQDLAQVRVQYDAAMGPPVPTPSAILLFGTGLAAMIGWNYRRTKKKL